MPPVFSVLKDKAIYRHNVAANYIIVQLITTATGLFTTLPFWLSPMALISVNSSNRLIAAIEELKDTQHYCDRSTVGISL